MAKFQCIIGDTLKLRMVVYEDDRKKAFENLTGKTLTFHASNGSGIEITKVIGDGITVLDAAQGSVEVYLAPDDTNVGDSPVGLRYTLRLQDGIDVYTLSYGVLSLILAD